MRVCTCGRQETLEEPFYKKSAVCRECYKSKKKPQSTKYRRRPETRLLYNNAARERRRNPLHRASTILRDSKMSDRRSGRSNDLTKESIESMISEGCYYCGETSLKMTLDRKDNSIGHLTSNVVPCCIRCNYIRRDMPFEAWLEVVPSIRRAREMGLFGCWTCDVHKRNGEYT